jgi:phosphoserine phosphatase
VNAAAVPGAVPALRAVYFDCDSTLTAIEGVDELLQFAPAALRAEIAAMTTAAMEGKLPLADVYATRLAKLAPTRDQLERVGQLYIERLTRDAAATVAALQHVGKHVGILSGGLLPPVQAVARHVGIPLANVHAVPIAFDAAGRYLDFDRHSPLARNGGKVEVARMLPSAHVPLAFVGDGVTDLETQGHVARFVGFGGVVVRSVVQAGAEVFVASPSLAAILPHVLQPAEQALLAADARFAPLLATEHS